MSHRCIETIGVIGTRIVLLWDTMDTDWVPLVSDLTPPAVYASSPAVICVHEPLPHAAHRQPCKLSQGATKSVLHPSAH